MSQSQTAKVLEMDLSRRMHKRDLVTIPNLFTASRILAIPIIMFFAYHDTPVTNLIAALTFGIVSLTDMVDGYLARRFNRVTRLGKLLDPLADKLVILTCMIMLLTMGKLTFSLFGEEWRFFGPLLVIITVGRSIAITGLRSIASGEGIIIAARKTGKVTTFIQSVAVFLLLLGRENGWPGIDWQGLGLVLLWRVRRFGPDFGVQVHSRFLSRSALNTLRQVTRTERD